MAQNNNSPPKMVVKKSLSWYSAFMPEIKNLLPFIFLVGYLDPGTGFMFSSMGPFILALLGGFAGTIGIFLSRFKEQIKEIFKRLRKTPKE
jgi:hypothetical protein